MKKVNQRKFHKLIVSKVNKKKNTTDKAYTQLIWLTHLYHPIFLINLFIFEKTEQEHGRPRDVVSQTSNP